MYYVYMIKNKINSKVYIGKTNDLEERWNKHLSDARCEPEGKYFVIHRALNKYGVENFDFSMVEEMPTEPEIFEREVYWIAFYKSNICRYGNAFGYNLTDGGEGASGHVHSEMSKLKMSKASKGKPKSEEHKSSLRLAHTGKVLTDEHKANIGKSGRGKKRTNKSKENYRQSKLGTKNPSAKLNETQVKEIKILINKKELSDSQIGTIFGVNRKTINDIRHGKTWSQIK
jgi:group I intron endonuclease